MYANRRCSKSKAVRSELLQEDTEGSTALDRTNSFRSENPFFIRGMYPSYIENHFMVPLCYNKQIVLYIIHLKS